MRSWLRIGVVGAGVLALLGAPFLSARASAQVSERFRVMVTNLRPMNDADDDFGKDMAKALRDLINQFPTHQPVEEKEIRDAARKYDIDMEDLGCIQALQLANTVNARIVFCGDYTEDETAKTVSLTGIQFAAPGGPSFEIADKTWHEDEHQLAAQEISSEFETYVAQLRSASFCIDYYNSKDWTSAEDNCTTSLAMNPADTQVRFIYAMVLRQTERYPEAYAEAIQVIELDPLDEGALQLAGYLAATLGDEDAGREHYTAYLQLNPGNVPVRLNIAYELAQAGDPEGAMLLTEEGMEIEPDNVDLLLQHASFATRTAQDKQAAGAPGEPLSLEVAELYRKAVASYDGAYEVRGVEMESGHLRNMIASYSELGQLEDAAEMAARALETHGEEAVLWSLNADILKKLDRVDEAITALNEVETRDPAYANVKARQGAWLVEVGREEEALPYLQQAVEKGEQSADAIASVLFGSAYRKGVDPKEWDYALRMIAMAKTFESQVSEGLAGQLDFWHGFVLYQQAVEEEEPQTLQTAQRTLPKFQQASRFFALPRVSAYAQSAAIGLQQFRDNSQQYIEIQEAIIQRGR